MSSFEEVNVQKMLLKVGKLEVVENPMFMTEARRKELERKERQMQRSREESTLMSI